MSKATFDEHFADKEECILALRDEATQILFEALWEAARAAPPDDAMAVAGAAVKLVSRQLRLGVPARMLDLQPVLERLLVGLLAPAPVSS